MAQLTRNTVVSIAGAVVLASCSTSVNPLSDVEGDRFVVHGFLTMETNHQQLRIAPLRGFIEEPDEEALDLLVTTEKIGAGHRIQWTAAENQPPDVDGTIYEAWFTPDPGSYRLEIRAGEDEPGLSARRTLPEIPSARVLIPRQSGGFFVVPVMLVDLKMAPDMMEIVYVIRLPDGSETTHIVPYINGTILQFGVWHIEVYLEQDRQTALETAGWNPSTDEATLISATARMRIPGLEFSRTSGGQFTRGFGFFSVVAFGESPIMFPSEVLSEAGFVP